MSHIFSGAAVNLAMQNGLHVLGVGQDFARVRLNNNEEEKISRARLWIYCIITAQSASYCDGLLPWMISSSADFDKYQTAMAHVIPPVLQYRERIHHIATDMISAVVRTGVTQRGSKNDAALEMLIELYDKELSRVIVPTSDDFAHLEIVSFYFFTQTISTKPMHLIKIYDDAVNAIEHATFIQDFALVCTFYFHRMLLLAAFCILKILRSDMNSAVDARAGERAYFKFILLLKEASVQHDDICSRGAGILTQLWASDNIFKRADGGRDSLSLRIQSRLTMSVVFDCHWWWREEFGGQGSPYELREESKTAKVSTSTEDASLTADKMASEHFGPPMGLHDPTVPDNHSLENNAPKHQFPEFDDFLQGFTFDLVSDLGDWTTETMAPTISAEMDP
ncbi:hypothetical protein AYO22_10450 [Fonsecaea multimorphosa]|nr:hypothetical protein AYO22_10450 [Fonsecaea multimorphosa]